MGYKERLSQEKAQKRKDVYDKTNGRCAYCGIELIGVFHLDHIEPKRRYKYSNGLSSGSDEIYNLFPSCQSCNSSKSDLSVEDFRDRISDRIKRLNDYSTEYRIAKRFGLIEEMDKDIIFYFEKLN